MTPRRPPGNFETWVEKEIRAAMERGEFQDLQGEGRPIADLHEPADELRWVRQKLKREGFTFLPASLALRKEAEDAREAAQRAGSEDEVRAIVEAINEKLLDAVRKPLSGPPVYVPPFELDAVLARWRESHPEPGPVAAPEPEPALRARRRWRRRTL